MPFITAVIERWFSDDVPGFVECSFVDANGRRWRFIEKVPVVTLEDLNAVSDYPRPVLLACQVLGFAREGVVDVTTAHPWGVVSVDDVDRFAVRTDQIVEHWAGSGIRSQDA